MSIQPTATIAANPSTERGVPVHLSYDARSNRVAYASGKSVFLRDVADPAKCTQYTGHNYKVTVAAFSPSGFYVASGDESGTVKVWDCATDEHILKGEYQVISGRINALAWDADSKRIIAVGDGKERYGHCFTYDSGNTVGEISGHTAQVNAVAIRPCRPYRAATVSDDGGLVFLQGPPFKFALSVRDKHTNFVRDVKFSPTGEYIVSVSADRSFCLYDGKSGEFVSKTEAAHDGGLFGVDWFDNDTFVTCSADATVKRFEGKSGKLVGTWRVGDKSVQNQLLGLVRTKDYVIALALSGDLYYFDETSEEPVRVVYGHQKSITALAEKEGRLFTGSYDGRLMSWDSEKTGTVLGGSVHTNLVVGIEPLGDELVTAGWDDKLNSVADGKLASLASLESQPIQIAAAATDKVAVITEDAVALYAASGELVKSLKLSFVPSAVALSSHYVVVTDSTTFQIKLFSAADLSPVSRTLAPLRAKPSSIAVSRDEKHVAVGDVTGKIFCYELEAGTLVTSRWAFHTSRITAIAWHEDNDHVITASLDTNLIVYSVSKPARNVKANNVHKEGISGVVWTSEKEAVSVGADACVKFWDVTFK